VLISYSTGQIDSREFCFHIYNKYSNIQLSVHGSSDKQWNLSDFIWIIQWLITGQKTGILLQVKPEYVFRHYIHTDSVGHQMYKVAQRDA
jgi:hypothetical protein